jgi:ketosteroid isomerase-like protein
MPPEDVIVNFYEALGRRDAEAMVACYEAEVRFSDPVFLDLRGDAAGDMWRMLCARGADLRVEYRDVVVDGERGSAHWEAWYTFSPSGRKVHNVIDASFIFSEDGKIATHTDSFDLKAWAAQALGPAGRWFGGSGFLQRKIRSQALAGLESYRRKHSPSP